MSEKRSISQELTAVIPREHLPPVSTSQLAAMDLDPDHPETQALVQRADDEAFWRTRETMVPCPLCIHGLVTPETAAAYAELMTPDDVA